MADDTNNLGDLTVSVTGDFSELQDAIDQAATVAQTGASEIAGSLQSISDASGLVGRDLEIFQEVVADLQSQGNSLAEALQLVSDSAGTLGETISSGATAALEQLDQAAASGAQSWDDMAAAVAAAGDSATEAAPQLHDAATATAEVATESPEAQSGLEGMAEGFLAVGEALAITEGLKEFIETAIEVYGQVQNIATSLEILGDTSDQAEEQLSSWADMANGLAIPLETLEQSARRLTVAFQGIEGIDVDTVLIAAADSAAETGRSFDTVATALQRVEATGQVTARQLQALGITWQQLADTAGVSVAQVQAELKKGAQSATDDLKLVVNTIETVMPGAAQAVAQNVGGQIQTLKNLVTETFEAIGQDIAPVIVTVVQGLDSIVQEAHTVATAFQQLPPDLQQGIVVAGLLAAALVPVAGALAGAGLAIAGLTSLVGALGIATTAEASAEGAAAIATAAHGAAAAAAAVGVEALAAAELENNGAIAVQMGLFGEDTIIATTAAKQISLFAEESELAAVNTGFLGTTLGATVGIIGTVVSGAVILTAQYHDLKDAATSTSGSFSILNDWFINVTGAAKNADDSLIHLSGGVNDLSAYLPTASQSFSTLWTAVKAGTGPIGAIAEGWDQAKEGINTAVGVITGKFSDMETAAANVAKANQDAANKTAEAWAKGATALTTSAAQTNQTEQQLVDQQVKLQGAVTQAAAAVADFSAKLNDNKSATQGGIAVTTLLAAEKVKLDAAQKALNSSLGIGSTVATVEKNSIQDIAGALATANDAVVNAQGSVDQLNQDLADGITQLGGFDIATELLPAALDRLTAATQRYLTAVDGGKTSVTGFVDTVTSEIGKLGTLVDTWTKLNAIAETTPAAAIAADNAFKQMQTVAAALGITLTNTGGIIQASVTDASKDSATAIQGLIDKFPQLNSAIDHTNDVMVNGQTITAGAQSGFIKFGDSLDVAAKSYVPFVGAVSDGTQKIGDMTISTNASVVALDAEGNAAADATPKVQAHTAATTAADKAAQALAQHQSDINKAWASGDIVVQKYNSDVAHVVGTLNDATTATNKYDSEYQKLNSTMTAVLGFGSNVDGAYQTIDGSIQAITIHAEQSAGAVQDLNNALVSAAASDAAWESASVSSLDGAKMGLSSYLSTALAVASSAATGGALGGGGIGGGQIDQMAQELANMTNQVVTTMDGTFIPAAQQAAEHLAGLQAQANATGKTLLDTFGGVQTVVTPQLTAFQQVTQANTASTTANTAATTANTAATTTVTTAATATVASLQDIQKASEALTAAEAQYAADLASGTGNVKQDLIDVGNAATALNAAVGGSTQAFSDNSAAVVASTTATTGVNTALASNIQAIQDQTGATATLTSAMATDVTSVNDMGQTVTEVTQPLTALQTSAKAVSQAQAQLALAQSQGTTDLGSFITAVNNAQAALNALELSSSTSAGNLGPIVASTSAGFTNPVQDQLNADIKALKDATDAYNAAVVAGTGDLQTLGAALNSAQNTLWSYQSQIAGNTHQVADGLLDMTQAIYNATGALATHTSAMATDTATLNSMGQTVITVTQPLTLLQQDATAVQQAIAQMALAQSLGTQDLSSFSAAVSKAQAQLQGDTLAQSTGIGLSSNLSGYGGLSSEQLTMQQENLAPAPMSGGVQLNVNVTGNSVTSQALVEQLANKVGSAIITNLRTTAGFKL